MPASAGGDGRGRFRGHIMGAKDKVSAAGTPYAAPHGKPECSSGLPLLVLKLYPELHSGIPPGREVNISIVWITMDINSKLVQFREVSANFIKVQTPNLPPVEVNWSP
ncbi:unnamed protein product, partial [Staurois parvus]